MTVGELIDLLSDCAGHVTAKVSVDGVEYEVDVVILNDIGECVIVAR